MSDFYRQLTTRGSRLWLGARAARNWYYNQGATFPRVTDFERRLAVAAIEELPKHFGRSGANITKLHESFHNSLNQAKNWWNQQHQRIIHLKPNIDFKTRPRVDRDLSMPDHPWQHGPYLDLPRTLYHYNPGPSRNLHHAHWGFRHWLQPQRNVMPPRRIAYKRRTTFRRRTTQRQTYGTRKFTQRLQPERKFRDIDITPVNLADTGAFLTGANALLGLAQGITDNTRIGRKISLTSIHIKGRIIWNPTIADQVNRCRLMIVLDTQANGAVPAAVTSLLTTANIDSYRNLLTGRRFKVLSDKTYVFNPLGTAETVVSATQQINLNFTKTWKKPLKVTYNNIGATITALQNYNVFVMGISAFDTDNIITYNVQTRLRYYDN